MVWFLLLFISPVFAQIDLDAIRALDEELPHYDELTKIDEETTFSRKDRHFRPLVKIIPIEKIKASGTQLGAINPGALLRDLSTNTNVTVAKPMYIRYFNFEDEHGFKYIQNKDGSIQWRILSRFVEPIKEELALYVPPHRYTPTPNNIIRAEYDKKLSIPPEFTFYGGLVKGDFMKDLFNDNKAVNGTSNQYGVHFFTQWKLPVKAGIVLHYENANYRLRDGGVVNYSAPSIGPQFKTREFEILGNPIRFQTQFRFSPFARAFAQNSTGQISYKFNSADLLTSIERPVKNSFGEFVWGLFFQSQWLNIKEQSNLVSVSATNETNKSFGLSFAQVFE